MTLLAHVGHWSTYVFFVPTLAFLVWLAVSQYRERRSGRAGAETGPPS